MAPAFRISLLILATWLLASAAWALDPIDYAVRLSATAVAAPASIHLQWEADADATGYTVSRKLAAATVWGAGQPLPASALEYTDTGAAVGVEYEYRVVKTTAAGYMGHGFISAGIAVPLVEQRGRVILIVDETQAEPLAAELALLEQDLAGDGWLVLRRDVPRRASPTLVKKIIATAYGTAPAGATALFLLGHVPVPYSGDICPDGHPDHQGAYPADVYYGDLTGTWTEHPVGPTERRRFAQNTVPGTVKLQLGRVDLSNMTDDPGFALSETELLRQYLQRDHDFRHRVFTATAQGIVFDGFRLQEDGYPYASDGWQGLSALYGPAAVREAGPAADALDWFQNLGSESFLMAYACGSGEFSQMHGTAYAKDFAAGTSRAVFVSLLGSYFGDWNTNVNFLRAPLAGAGYGLATFWGGVPKWYVHPMGQGHTIGYCAQLTQNNSTLYPAGEFPRGVHVALMGDPTLRLQGVAPASGLVATLLGTTSNVQLSWTASSDTVSGYHLYRAPTPAGPFTRLNSALITGTTFTTSTAALPGEVYEVRAVRLETTNSGSYWNASQGIFGILQDPVISLSPATATLSTAVQATTELSFTRTGPTTQDLLVAYAVTGSALAGVDYRALAGSITIPAGQTTATVRIEVLSPPSVEKQLKISLQNGVGYLPQTSAPAVVTIASGTKLFAPYQGTYSAALEPADLLGSATVTVTAGGGSTVLLQLGSRRYPATGVFQANGTASFAIPGKPGVFLDLQFDSSTAPPSLLGTLRQANATPLGHFMAEHPFAGPGATLLRGAYTFALPSQNAPPNQGNPAGAAIGTGTVDGSGKVRLAGLLTDGTAFTAGGAVSASGTLLLVQALPGAGLLSGAVKFAEIPGESDATGTVQWSHAGTVEPLTLVASRYVAPAAGHRLFTWENVAGNGVWSAAGGGVSPALQEVLTLSNTNLALPLTPGVNHLSLTVAAGSGRLSGTFTAGSPARILGFSAIALQKQNQALGFFRLMGHSGLITVSQNQVFTAPERGGAGGYWVRPTVQIAEPLVGARLPEAAAGLTLRGTATSAMDIDYVQYQVLHDGDISSLNYADGLRSWNIPLTFTPAQGGLYTVYVKAVDMLGNESLLAARSFTYVVLRPLAVTISGSGTVTAGFAPTSTRQVGQEYTITALPKAGQRFTGWSGGIVSEAPQLTFTMVEGLALQANFAPR